MPYDALGDQLAACDRSELEARVRALADELARQLDRDALESLLHALVRAAARGGGWDPATFTPVVEVLPRLPVELLGYAFEVLALSHLPAFESVLRSYLAHHSSSVRTEARDALVELAGRR